MLMLVEQVEIKRSSLIVCFVCVLLSYLPDIHKSYESEVDMLKSNHWISNSENLVKEMVFDRRTKMSAFQMMRRRGQSNTSPNPNCPWLRGYSIELDLSFRLTASPSVAENWLP